MVTLLKQERSNGDVTSTLLLRKNGRASSPTIFSKNFAAGSVLSILFLTDTVYFTLPFTYDIHFRNVAGIVRKKLFRLMHIFISK